MEKQIPTRIDYEREGLTCVLHSVYQFFPEYRLGQFLSLVIAEFTDSSISNITDNQLAEAILKFGNKYLKGQPYEVRKSADSNPSPN